MELAKNFFKYWCEVVEARSQEVDDNWYDNKAYTNLVIHSPNSIVVDIAKKLNLYCYNGDYYYLDSVFYDEPDYISDFQNQCFLTDIRIAFEHENNFKSGLFQEVSHLLLINSDLKVVVSYPPSEKAEHDELQYLHQIVKSSRVSEHLSDTNGFLFIMGHSCLYRWEGWIYKETGWEKLLTKSSR